MIIDEVLKREREKKRKDSGWQPVPLYEELELPIEVERRREESPGRTEIDVWGPKEDPGITVIETRLYHTSRLYQ